MTTQTSPSIQLRQRPVTVALVVALGVWHTWFGVWLYIMPKTEVRKHTFRGPLSLFTYTQWSVLFVIAGLTMLATLFFRESERRYELIAPALPALAWAGGWWAGPLSTAQPTYTLLALLVVAQPWIHRFAQRYLVLEPRAARPKS